MLLFYLYVYFVHARVYVLQKTSITKKITSVDRDLPHNMSKKDMIRSTDFNFLMVLGKGSFGKVLLNFIIHTNRFVIVLFSLCVSTTTFNLHFIISRFHCEFNLYV